MVGAWLKSPELRLRVDPGGAADETDTTSANPDTAPVYEG